MQIVGFLMQRLILYETHYVINAVLIRLLWYIRDANKTLKQTKWRISAFCHLSKQNAFGEMKGLESLRPVFCPHIYVNKKIIFDI